MPRFRIATVSLLAALLAATAHAQDVALSQPAIFDLATSAEATLDDDRGYEFMFVNYQPPAATQPPSLSTPRSRGATGESPIYRLASVPNMFGDFFGGGTLQVEGENISGTSGPLPVVAGGGAAVRRVKLSENNSPLPRDRVFFNYNYFNDVVGFGDVNRYTPGLEKTFWDGQQSIEIRLPIAATLSSDQTVDQAGARDTEVGNLTATWKTLLYVNDLLIISGGLGVTAPTADGTRIFGAGGEQILGIENESVHLLPYVSFLLPGNLFMQGFVQLDVDTNGDTVNEVLPNGNLQRIGRLQDATLLFVDLSFGYWAYENPYAHAITGVVPIIEFHYSGTLQDADSVSGGGFAISDAAPRFDVVTITTAVSFLFGPNLTVTPALVTPINTNPQFDYEAGVQINYWF